LRAWLIIDSYIKLIFYRSLFYKSVFEQYIIINDLYMHNFREKERERERERERCNNYFKNIYLKYNYLTIFIDYNFISLYDHISLYDCR